MNIHDEILKEIEEFRLEYGQDPQRIWIGQKELKELVNWVSTYGSLRKVKDTAHIHNTPVRVVHGCSNYLRVTGWIVR